jgi:membrane fusion protein (multidrug efflux system)
MEAAKRQREALNTKDDVYKADIEAKKAAIVVAEVNLAYTRIAAPTDGTVGERHALAGQLVAPGTQVIEMVQSEVWVQANYKETQLTNMRVGDPADVRVDTFPNRMFHGKVEQLSPASGSQFALLPPDNATGNFTKVVQRIPVKVVLSPGQPYLDRLRPGLSAEVTIHTGKDGSRSAGGE